jgi:hypothetical protein
MIKKILFLILFAYILFVNSYGAAPIHGEILYRNVGGLKYVVEFKYGRDCRGIPSNNISAMVYNDSFSITLNPIRVSIYNHISPNCTSGCNPPNTISGQGKEIHSYIDTIDFSIAPFNKFGTFDNPNVYFSLQQCCRVGAISTFSPGGFYVDAMLNLYYMKTQNEKLNTPEFYQILDYRIPYNYTFNHSFASIKGSELDSISYELDRPMSNKNKFENYNIQYPFTYKCSSPSETTCTPGLSFNPVRGFYFDPKLGNLIFTPFNQNEMTALVLRRNIYRKLNNKHILVGYTKLDQQIVVYLKGDVPYSNHNNNLQIKAREQFCKDIVIKDNKDDQTNRVDTIEVVIHQQPQYGKLSLTDSFSTEKTLRYCWTPKIDDYLLNNEDYFVFTAKQKRCLHDISPKITKAISVSVLAPDSLSQIIVRTFSDANKNGIKDFDEDFKPASFYLKRNSNFEVKNSNQSGENKFSLIKGNLEIGILSNAMNAATSNPIILQSEFDSSYIIQLGFYETPGIKGKIILDKNENCSLDSFEIGLLGVKIYDKYSNNTAFADANGNFFLPFDGGNYELVIDLQNKYKINCSNSLIGFLPPNSIFSQLYFFLNFDSIYDISVVQVSNNFHKNNSQYTSQILLKNNSNKGFSPSQLVLKSSQVLNQFSSINSHQINAKNIVFFIDSIKPLESKTIVYKHFVMRDTNYQNNSLCFDIELKTIDDNLLNNQYVICEPVLNEICCQTNKYSYSPKEITDISPFAKYKVLYNHQSTSNAFFVLEDNLDTSIFDISTFKIIENPFNFNIQIYGNELRAELINQSLVLNVQLYLLFEIGFKKQINKRFDIRNKANWTINLTEQFLTQETQNQTSSTIVFNQINPTNICQGESVLIDFKTKYEPKSDNHFLFLISDSVGGFINSNIIFDTAMVKSDKVLLRIPENITPGNYLIKVIGTSPNTALFEEDINQFLIINKKPIVGLISNINDGIVCENDSIILFANGDQEFQFYFNQIALHNYNSTNQFIFKPTVSGDFFVKTRTMQNCMNQSEKISFSLKSLPDVKVELLNHEICEGDILNLKLTGANAYNVIYSNDTFYNFIGSEYNKVAVINSNKFLVYGNSEFKCQKLDSIEFDVFSYAEKPIINNVNNVLYSNLPNYNQWYLNDKLIIGANQNSYAPMEAGTYKVSNKPIFECISFSDDYVFNKVNIEQNSHQKSIFVYPNPSNNILNIENHFNKSIIINIYSFEGKMIERISVNTGFNQFDVSAFSSGLYVLKSNIEGQSIAILLTVNK